MVLSLEAVIWNYRNDETIWSAKTAIVLCTLNYDNTWHSPDKTRIYEGEFFIKFLLILLHLDWYRKMERNRLMALAQFAFKYLYEVIF
jgi:hypothetical protein